MVRYKDWNWKSVKKQPMASESLDPLKKEDKTGSLETKYKEISGFSRLLYNDVSCFLTL